MSVLSRVVFVVLFVVVVGSTDSLLPHRRHRIHSVSMESPNRLRTNGFAREADSSCDNADTRLSWQSRCGTNSTQVGYEIEARNQSHLKWSSSKVDTNVTMTSYEGDSIRADEIVSWRVRTYCTDENKSTAWSEYTTIRGARCFESDWTGKWITTTAAAAAAAVPNQLLTTTTATCPSSTNPIFKQTFQVPSSNKNRAMIFIAGLGYFRVRLNGKDVSNETFLDPPLTTFSKRVSYATYNVTNVLKYGVNNTISVELGSGWWNLTPMLFWGTHNIRENMSSGQPQFRLDLVIVNEDNKIIISSDETWQYTDGAYTFNDIYLGTKFDARIHNNNNSKIFRPVSIASLKNLTLRPYTIPPIRVFETLEAKLVPGTVSVYDFGRNFAGTVKYRFQGSLQAGTVFKFRYGEILFSNNTVNGLTSVAGQIKSGNGGVCAPDIAYQEDIFISDHLQDKEIFEYIPRFTWHGFRYVQVFSTNPTAITSVQGLALRTDVDTATASTFKTKTRDESTHRLDTLHAMIRNTFSSNMMSIQSDCPHRERFGYGGDLLATFLGGT